MIYKKRKEKLELNENELGNVIFLYRLGFSKYDITKMLGITKRKIFNALYQTTQVLKVKMIKMEQELNYASKIKKITNKANCSNKRKN